VTAVPDGIRATAEQYTFLITVAVVSTLSTSINPTAKGHRLPPPVR
jgi:hypothetical protein